MEERNVVPKLVREFKTKSRGVYRCDCCGGVIKKGTPYIHKELKDASTGERYWWSSHVHCDNLTSKLPEKYHKEGFDVDDFKNFCIDHILKKKCKGCPYHHGSSDCRMNRGADFCSRFILKWYER